MTAALDAAYVASVLPMTHPLAQIARLHLDAHVRNERHTMTHPLTAEIRETI